ncbi:hypothetical protein [Deinococcus apachensis]|uniref:hypothetical protein n=1 Tax=Deinococcus apachensis TaxID=309886 RepID=UPI000363CDEC|nr:hypothetical protein [Deinococcus apachensis]
MSAETCFGGLPTSSLLTVDLDSGTNTSVTVFAGYHAPGADLWIQVGDVSLTPP